MRITPNETELSRGEWERASLRVEGFQSCEKEVVRRLAVGCSDLLGDAVASARAHVAQMHRTPRSLVGTASSMSTVSLMFVHQQAPTDSSSAMTQRLG